MLWYVILDDGTMEIYQTRLQAESAIKRHLESGRNEYFTVINGIEMKINAKKKFDVTITTLEVC
jgi:hypothetical protein